MKYPEDIILRPVITERSTEEQAQGRYTFYVAPDATKPEIRQAAEQLFQVKVTAVNTIKVPSKTKRVRYKAGRTAERKKAIVTIDQEAESITYTTKGGKETQATRKFKTSIEDFGFGQ